MKSPFKVLVSAIMVLALFSCGMEDDGNGSGGGGGSGWVSIRPEGSITTSYSSVYLEGNAWHEGALTGTIVVWTNTTTGQSGTASSGTSCLVFCMVWWEATVPVAMGSNVVTVTASVNGALIGTKSVSITRN